MPLFDERTHDGAIDVFIEMEDKFTTHFNDMLHEYTRQGIPGDAIAQAAHAAIAKLASIAYIYDARMKKDPDRN